ncbi:hypothetical protein LPW41_07615 [Microbacterium sp. JC 701]|uniref:hypothetical protein n=1 Tax=Microbacterium sp. JC 701 TaxID=2897389 RepID=UPI001E4C9F4F|nr:hypothetical protein [Microbacterium sp. JC 701]MCD2169570.1 hypothetical protein [Microbacterium sp. JC 701]
MTSSTLPLIDSAGTRRNAFLALVRDEDIMRSLDTVPDDTLVTVGLGLAVEAYEGRWNGSRDLAVARFDIPADVVELLAAAALTALTPTMGAIVLARPTEATLGELRAWLASHGFKATVAHTPTKGKRRAT